MLVEGLLVNIGMGLERERKGGREGGGEREGERGRERERGVERNGSDTL